MSTATNSSRPYRAASASPDENPPLLAAGTELLGRFQGSGSVEAPYLLRRADGRVFEVSSLLHLVASAIDGRRTLAQVATSVSKEGGRRITADQIDHLVQHKLRPLGLTAGTGGEPSQPSSRPPLLGLTLARAVVPAPVVDAATRILSPLFFLPVVVAVVSAVVAFDVWLLIGGRVAAAMHQVLATPVLVLAMAAVTIVGGAFHELGHASASRRGGARAGVIGVGIYLLWPVFYNDLNDSYRLSRAGRLRVDLGGIYFNAVLIAALASIYALTSHPVLLVAIVFQHLAIAQQLLPFLRLDGYYLVSDIAGVPDLFARVRPVLVRLVAGGAGPSGASDLTPGARRIVTAWVLTLVPLLGAAAIALTYSLPGFLVTAAGAIVAQVGNLVAAGGRGDVVTVTMSLLQLAVYAVPVVGLGVTLARALRRLSVGEWWGAPSSAFREEGTGIHRLLDTRRAGRVVAGVLAVDLCVATAVLFGALSLPTSPEEPSGPVAAAVVVPEPVLPPTTLVGGAVTTVPSATLPTTTLATITVPSTTVSSTTASSTTAPSTTAPSTTAPPTISARPDHEPRPAPGVEPVPMPVPPPPAPAEPAAPGPVARRQPSSAEVQRAIDGFRPYVQSIVPVSPSPEQVAELGNKICTAFDGGHSVAEVKQAGREMAEGAPFVSVRKGGEDYIVRTGVALYCPGHAANLA